MATRVYLPSTGSAAVTPSSWNFANQINPLTFAGVLTKISSTMTSKAEATGTTSPTARAMLRYVIGPLAAQTISGTVRGQMRCSENNTGANATLALAVKIIQPGGSDRAVLLAQTASDSATSPFEMLTTLTNRQFNNAAESNTPTLTNGDATDSDYLVIEIGFRSATTTSRTITLSYGDNSATDLAIDTTTTTANNPWIEFSNTIKFIAEADAASSGVAASSVAGAAVFAGVANSDGVGAASSTSATIFAGVASSAGVATVSGDGEAVTSNYEEADGSAAGVAAVDGIGAAVFAGDASSAGVATVSSNASAIGALAALADGVAAVSGVASSLAQADGGSSGSASVAAVATAFVAADSSSSGAASSAVVGAAVFASVASSDGVAVVAADGEDAGGAPTEADGVAAGVATASAVGAAIVSAVAQAQGESTALAVSDSPVEEEEVVLGHEPMTTFSFWQDFPPDVRRLTVSLKFGLRITVTGTVSPVSVRGEMRIGQKFALAASGQIYGVARVAVSDTMQVRLIAYGHVDNSRPKRMRDERALMALI